MSVKIFILAIPLLLQDIDGNWGTGKKKYMETYGKQR
jgi:hypothetical protein